MQIVKLKDNKSFALAGLSFSQLKIIKDSCLFAGKNGSLAAKEMAMEIEKMMGDITI